jgi:ribonucleotide reductase alpha subunit
MNEITMTTTYALSDEAIVDILDGALEGGIGYWAAEGNYDVDAKTFFIKEDEYEGEGREYNRTFTDLVTAAAKIAAGQIAISGEIRRAIVEAFSDYDDCDLDADAYDCIIQVACFNELVYG